METEQGKQLESLLNSHNLLTSKVKNQINHNPFIDEHIGDTLYNVESALRFIQHALTRTESGEVVSLSEAHAQGLFMIQSCIVSAVNFEQQRAILMSR